MKAQNRLSKLSRTDLAELINEIRDENEIAIAVTSEDFEYMMSVTDECFFVAPVWKPIRNRLRKDEHLEDVCFTALGEKE